MPTIDTHIGKDSFLAFVRNSYSVFPATIIKLRTGKIALVHTGVGDLWRDGFSITRVSIMGIRSPFLLFDPL